MPRAIEEGTYLESLLKNIPSEAIAGYLGMTSLMSAMPVGTAKNVLEWLIFAVCLGTVRCGCSSDRARPNGGK